MPKVQKTAGVQISREFTPYYRVLGGGADAFGADKYQAVQQAGQALTQTTAQVAQAEQNFRDRRSTTHINEGLNSFDEMAGKTRQDYYALRGKAAVDAGDPTIAALKKHKADVLKNYTGETRARLAAAIDARINNSTESILRQHATNLREWEKGVAQGRYALQGQNAADNYTVDSEIERSLGEIELVARDESFKEGLSADEIDAEVRKQQGVAIGLAFDRALSHEDTDRAKELLEQYGDKVGPELKTKMKEALKNTSRLKETQERTDSITATTSDPDERIAQARKIKDSELRKEVVNAIKIRNKEDAAREVRMKKEAGEKLFSLIQKGTARTRYELQRAAPNAWAWAEKDPVIMSNIEARLQAEADGREYALVPDGDLIRQIKTLSVADLKGMTLAEVESYKARMDQKSFNDFHSAWVGAHVLEDQMLRDPKPFNTGEDVVDQHRSAEKDSDEYRNVQTAMATWIANYIKQYNKVPKGEEYDEMAAMLWSDADEWFGVDTFAEALIKGEVPSDFQIEGLPAKEQADWKRLTENYPKLKQLSDPDEWYGKFLQLEFQADGPGQQAMLDALNGRPAQRPQTLSDQLGLPAPVPREEQAAPEALPQARGASEDYMAKLEKVESAGNPNAQARTSSATGLHQFTEGTWDDVAKKGGRPELVGRYELRTDPQTSREMAALLTEQNGDVLRARGVEVTDSALYLAHFLGAGAAARVYNAGPEAPVSRLVSKGAIKANPNVFKNVKTASDLIEWAQGKMR